MKINCLGNTPLLYLISKGIRNSGHSSTFFQETGLHPRMTLAWDQPEISDEDCTKIRTLDFLGSSPFSPAGQAILSEIQDCDFMVCMGLSAYWAVLSNRPFLYIPFGGDMSRWPFLKDNPTERARALYMNTILKEAGFILNGLHSKRHLKIMEQLGIPRERFRTWLQPVDTDFYIPFTEEKRALLRKEAGCADKFVIFIPSQLHFRIIRELNFSKGTDRFIEGIRQFSENARQPVELWLTYRGWDRKEAVQLVKDAGLEKITRWLAPCSKLRLIEKLNMADVVLDQIFPDIGNHGVLLLEAMATATPVCSYIDHQHRKKVGEPPIPNINVRTPEDVAESLHLLAEDEAYRTEIGNRGREFILKHHSLPVSTSSTIKIGMELLEAHSHPADSTPQ